MAHDPLYALNVMLEDAWMKHGSDVRRWHLIFGPGALGALIPSLELRSVVPVRWCEQGLVLTTWIGDYLMEDDHKRPPKSITLKEPNTPRQYAIILIIPSD